MNPSVSAGSAFVLLVSTLTVVMPSTTFAQESEAHYVYVEPIPDWAKDYASNTIYYATNSWQDANPHIKFYQAASPEEADLLVQWIRDYGTDYLGETIGGNVIQVGLGNSACMSEWHPFSEETVTLIAKHEIGHYLGLGHSSDPDSIMYPTLVYRYGVIETQESLAPNYAWFVPNCSPDNVTRYGYQVETDDPTYGFDVYFVPEVWQILFYVRNSHNGPLSAIISIMFVIIFSSYTSILQRFFRCYEICQSSVCTFKGRIRQISRGGDFQLLFR